MAENILIFTILLMKGFDKSRVGLVMCWTGHVLDWLCVGLVMCWTGHVV